MWRKNAIKLAPKGQKYGQLFENTNRGKRSVVLDLKTTKDMNALLQILETADVFLTNVRVKGLQRLKLDYDTIHSRFPHLIYAHLTAWGRAGPHRDDAGYDAGAFWAATGIQDITRHSDDSPPSRYPGGIGDHTTGLALLSGIGMALFHREKNGGHGQLVDASLLRVGAWVTGVPLMLAAGERGALGVRGQRRDRTQHSIPTFNTYKTKDGAWIQLLGLDFERHIEKTLRCLGISQILENYSDFRDMMVHRREIIKAMSNAFEKKTIHEWTRLMRESDVWFSPMRKFEDVLDWEQLVQTGGVDNVPGISHGVVATPVKLSACEQKARGRAPNLGEHTNEILRDVGVEEVEMRRSKL